MADDHGHGRTDVAWHVLVLAIVWVAAMAYGWTLLDRGWVPHDEGTLAQSALRTLEGEVPHRDFDDIYTGGLTYLNALAFTMWGVHLLSMRYMAYLFFACWIPVVYYLASRWMRPPAAGLLTLTAVAWSYPTYPAAMPSWYMLYCVTGTVGCLTRYVDVRKARWLVAAGGFAGLSCLFKIVGLYAVAGSLLLLVYLEQRIDAADQHHDQTGVRWYGALTSVGLVCFAASVYFLVLPRMGVREFLQFVLPSWTSVGLLLATEWGSPRGNDAKRFRTAVSFVGPFAAGVVFPILIIVAYFMAQGGITELVADVLVKPFRRLTLATRRPPPALAVFASILLATVLILGERLSRVSRVAPAIAVAGLGFLLLAFGGTPGIDQLGYLSISQSVPLVVLASAVTLGSRRRSRALPGATVERLALLAFTCATYTLIQYPFSTPTYFAFIAPLVFLSAGAVVTSRSRNAGPALAALLVAYACYGVLWFAPRQFRFHNSRGLLRGAEVETVLPGLADLKVVPSDSREYGSLMPLIAGTAKGEYIFAGPDSPEVYFLSGRKNPTRTLFDFLDNPEGRTGRILEAIERHGVRLVVINDQPLLSAPLEPALLRALRYRYPHDSVIGRFTVRWN